MFRSRFLRRRVAPLPTAWSEQHAKDIFAYQMISQRQLEQDSMLWQTPALAITGQAFLLLIAFTPSDSFWAKFTAGVVGAFVALISMQLMSKHHYLSALDISEMVKIEERLGIPSIAKRGWGYGRKRRERSPGMPKRGWVRGLRSYWVWIVGMWVFFAANVLAIALAFFP